jgi:predicted phage terminase large subunit-like protein
MLEYQKNQNFNFPTLIRMEQYWITRAQSNVVDFMIYLSDGQLTPPKHHAEWLDAIFDLELKYLNIFAFPGSGKTSCLVHAVAFQIGRYPWLTHLVCSVSEEQAKERLSNIREIVEGNERYKNVFPWVLPPPKGARPNDSTKFNVWADRWGVEDDKPLTYAGYRNKIAKLPAGSLRDHTCFAAGITSRTIMGKRISGFILVDDPHDENNSATPEQRFKVYSFVQKTVQTRLTGALAKIAVISNRWAEDDLSGRLSELKRGNGKYVWHTMNTPVMDEDRKPTWPEVWPIERIEEVAESLDGEESAMFKMSYKNDPLGASTGEYTFDMFKKGLPDEMPFLNELWITTDFAESESVRADYSVYAALGKDDNFNVYLLDMMRFKKTKVAIKVEKLIEFYDDIYDMYHENARVKGICMETRDSLPEAQAIAEDRPDIHTKIIVPKGNKVERHKAVARKVQVGKFFFNTKMGLWRPMVGELMSFPRGKHDDMVDTISLVFQNESWDQTKKARAGGGVIISPYML